jgi:hypothetical protein
MRIVKAEWKTHAEIAPDTRGTTHCTMGAKSNLSDLQLLALWIPRRLVLVQFVVAQHVQQRRLPRIVESKEENARFLIVQSQGGEDVPKPVQTNEHMKYEYVFTSPWWETIHVPIHEEHELPFAGG